MGSQSFPKYPGERKEQGRRGASISRFSLQALRGNSAGGTSSGRKEDQKMKDDREDPGFEQLGMYLRKKAL